MVGQLGAVATITSVILNAVLNYLFIFGVNIGDTLFALIMDVGFLWLLALPLGWLAVSVWHLPFWAVYLCILSEPVCKSIVGLNRLLSNKWLRSL